MANEVAVGSPRDKQYRRALAPPDRPRNPDFLTTPGPPDGKQAYPADLRDTLLAARQVARRAHSAVWQNNLNTLLAPPTVGAQFTALPPKGRIPIRIDYVRPNTSLLLQSLIFPTGAQFVTLPPRGPLRGKPYFIDYILPNFRPPPPLADYEIRLLTLLGSFVGTTSGMMGETGIVPLLDGVVGTHGTLVSWPGAQTVLAGVSTTTASLTAVVRPNNLTDMSNVLYANSTGEIRERLLDEDGNEVTSGTVTCTLTHGSTTIFSARSMSYSASKHASPELPAGCWYCTVASTEVTSVQGVYTATVTAIDGSGNQLVTEVEISVETYTGGP